jgi:hypothetical protein
MGCLAYDKKINKFTPESEIEMFLRRPDGWVLHSRYVDVDVDVKQSSPSHGLVPTVCYYYCNPLCPRCITNSQSQGTFKNPGMSLGSALATERALELSQRLKTEMPITMQLFRKQGEDLEKRIKDYEKSTCVCL